MTKSELMKDSRKATSYPAKDVELAIKRIANANGETYKRVTH